MVLQFCGSVSKSKSSPEGLVLKTVRGVLPAETVNLSP